MDVITNKQSCFNRINGLVALLPFLLFMPSTSFSQEVGGWLYVAEAPAYSTWRPNDLIETQKGAFLVAFWDFQKDSHILKLSEDGELLSEQVVSLIDTIVIISRLFDLDNDSNEHIALALCRPESGDADAIMTMHFDDNLCVIQRNVVSCTDLEQSMFNMCVLKQSNDFIIAITDWNYSHYFMKLDLDGDLLGWKNMEMDSLIHICNLFEIQGEEGSYFGMYAHTSSNGDAQMGVLVFDDSLELLRRAYFAPWQNEETGGNICWSFMRDAINSMIIPSPDNSGFLISSRLSESLYTHDWHPLKNDRSTIIAKTDLDFAMQEDYFLVGHLNDTVEVPAFYRSIDYHPNPLYSKSTYQCTMQGLDNESLWPMALTSLGLVVTKVNEDFNLIWKKRFLTEKEFYPFAITGTRDGGCAVTGMVYDQNNERRLDLFVFKIDADGTVGVSEIQEENMAFVYPNPAKEAIRIGGVEAKETKAYNVIGQQIMSFNGNEANVETLPEGVYLLKVTDTESRTQTIRLIVKK